MTKTEIAELRKHLVEIDYPHQAMINLIKRFEEENEKNK